MKREATYIARAPQPCRDAACDDQAVPGMAYCAQHEAGRQRVKRETTSAAYQTPAYRRARRMLLAKYGPGCWVCSRTDSPHAHHIDGRNTNHRLSNLAVLCARCHGQIEREIDTRRPGPITRQLSHALTVRDHTDQEHT